MTQPVALDLYADRKDENLIFRFFHTILVYREYLKQSVARDLRKRYKRSVLGYVWSMLHPLLMMTILAIVFSNIMASNVKDYAVFLFSGMIAWKFFTATATESLNAVSNNVKLTNQVPVPKYLFVLTNAFSNLVDFLLTLAPLFLVMLVTGRGIPVTVLALPLVLIPLFCVSVALALLFATSNVFFRDTQHLSGVILQALYFLSPILYTRDRLPEWIIPYVTLNPMFPIIEMMHSIFYTGTLPDTGTYLLLTGVGLLLLLCSLWIFTRADRKFIYFV